MYACECVCIYKYIYVCVCLCAPVRVSEYVRKRVGKSGGRRAKRKKQQISEVDNLPGR